MCSPLTPVVVSRSPSLPFLGEERRGGVCDFLSEAKVCHPERRARDLGEGRRVTRTSHHPPAQVPRSTLGMTAEGSARRPHPSWFRSRLLFLLSDKIGAGICDFLSEAKVCHNANIAPPTAQVPRSTLAMTDVLAAHTLRRFAVAFFSISSQASTPATEQRAIFSWRVSSILRTIGTSCQVAIVETMPFARPRAVRPARWT